MALLNKESISARHTISVYVYIASKRLISNDQIPQNLSCVIKNNESILSIKKITDHGILKVLYESCFVLANNFVELQNGIETPQVEALCWT